MTGDPKKAVYPSFTNAVRSCASFVSRNRLDPDSANFLFSHTSLSDQESVPSHNS